MWPQITLLSVTILSIIIATYELGRDENMSDYIINISSIVIVYFLLYKGGYFDILIK